MKKLVAYYSFGGNTRAVAEKIARALRADIIEIRTVKDYPDDFDVLLSLGKKEVESGYMPAIRPLLIDFDRYDAIIIGTPVWWSTFAPAIKKFMSGYRWKGRRIYPFATNEGTLGHTSSDFKKALRGATVEPILNVKFQDRKMVTPDSTIKEWVEGIKRATAEEN